MPRFFYIILLFLFIASCSHSGDRPLTLSPPDVYRFFPAGENRLPRVNDFFPSYYNIELVDIDSLHPVMQITYTSRRPSAEGNLWVDAVLRMDITTEQRTQLQELLREVAFSPHH